MALASPAPAARCAWHCRPHLLGQQHAGAALAAGQIRPRGLHSLQSYNDSSAHLHLGCQCILHQRQQQLQHWLQQLPLLLLPLEVRSLPGHPGLDWLLVTL